MKEIAELVVADIGPAFRRPILVFSVVYLVSGCSARELYRAGQDYQRQECHNVRASEYEGCMERANKSYEDYERIKNGDKRPE